LFISITTAANWATNCIVSFLVPVFLESLTYGTYLIFGNFCVLMGIIIYLFYPETKGKSLEDMDHVFGRSIFAVKLFSKKKKLNTRMKYIEKQNRFNTNLAYSKNELIQIYRF